MAASDHTAHTIEQSGAERTRVRKRQGSVPEDFAQALARQPRAQAFFDKLSAEHRYAMLRRLHAVRRGDTRGKRIALIVAMLARRER